jgi:hypothetical protein
MSPKVPAKVAKDALRIATAKAVVWIEMLSTRRVQRPSATGGNG